MNQKQQASTINQLLRNLELNQDTVYDLGNHYAKVSNEKISYRGRDLILTDILFQLDKQDCFISKNYR